ncbi:hypothetical protein GEMRC1_003420 [Eukaryota sp. GEM-RC1]
MVMTPPNDFTNLKLVSVLEHGTFDLGGCLTSVISVELSTVSSVITSGYLHVLDFDLQYGTMKFCSISANTTLIHSSNPVDFENSNLIIEKSLEVTAGHVRGIHDSVITVLDTATLVFRYTSSSFSFLSSDSSSRIINYGVITDSSDHTIATTIRWFIDDHATISFNYGTYHLRSGFLLRGSLSVNTPCTVNLFDSVYNTTTSFKLFGDGSLNFNTDSDTSLLGVLSFAGDFELISNSRVVFEDTVTVSTLIASLVVKSNSYLQVKSISNMLMSNYTDLSGDALLEFVLPSVYVPEFKIYGNSIVSSSSDTVINVDNEFLLESGTFAPKHLVYVPLESQFKISGDPVIDDCLLLVHGLFDWLSGNFQVNTKILVNETGVLRSSLSANHQVTTNNELDGLITVNSLTVIDNSAPSIQATFRISSIFENSTLNVETGKVLLEKTMVILFIGIHLWRSSFDHLTTIHVYNELFFSESGTTDWRGHVITIDSGVVNVETSHVFNYNSTHLFDEVLFSISNSAELHLISSLFRWNSTVFLHDSALFDLHNLSLSIPYLEQFDTSTVTGTFNFYITDLFTWNGGFQLGSGATILNTSMLIQTTTTKQLYTRGIHVLHFAQHDRGHLTGGAEAAIIVYPDAEFYFSAEFTTTVNHYENSDWYFIIHGLLTLDSTGSTNIYSNFRVFNGTVTQNAGTFRIRRNSDIVDSVLLINGGTFTPYSSSGNLITIRDSLLNVSGTLETADSGDRIFKDVEVNVFDSASFDLTAGDNYFRGLLKFSGEMTVSTTGKVYFDDDVLVDWDHDDLIRVQGSAVANAVIYFNNCSNTVFPTLSVHVGSYEVNNDVSIWSVLTHSTNARRYGEKDATLFVINFMHLTSSYHYDGRTEVLGHLLIESPTRIRLYRDFQLIIKNTSRWINGNIRSYTDAIIIVAETGEFHIDTSGSVTLDRSSGSPVLYNYGTIIVDSGVTLSNQYATENYGIYHVTGDSYITNSQAGEVEGDIYIDQGSEFRVTSGTWNFSPSSNVQSTGIFRSSTNVNFRGTYNSTFTTVTSSTLSFEDPIPFKWFGEWRYVPGANIISLGTTSLSGTIDLNKNSYTFYDDFTVSGSFRFDSNVTIEAPSLMTWSNGNLYGGYLLVNSKIEITSTSTRNLRSTHLTINNTVSTWEDGGDLNSDGDAVLLLLPGSVLTAEGTSSRRLFQSSSSAKLVVSEGALFDKVYTNTWLYIYGSTGNIWNC